MTPRTRSLLLVAFWIATGSVNASCHECPTVICPDAFVLLVSDESNSGLPTGVYHFVVDVDGWTNELEFDCEIPTEDHPCTRPPDEANSELDAYVVVAQGVPSEITLEIRVADDDGPGERMVTVSLTAPSGEMYAGEFAPVFEKNEPGGPRCETCLGAGSEDWKLPLAQ